MKIAETRVISIGIRCPYPKAYEFLSSPENFPKWASGLGRSLRRDGERWIMETPEGSAEVRFTPKNAFGVLDHFVCPKQGVEIYVPMRVVPNGQGCEVMLMLFRQSGMPDERFERDTAWVRRDLQTLKDLLEA